MQPLVKDDAGVIRFAANPFVRHLLDKGGLTMNDLAAIAYPDEAFAHFAQLIGYSLSGYHELNYVSDTAALAASEEARKQWPDAKGCRDDGCPLHCGVVYDTE